MVELGTTRRNPDYYAIEVFNEAFGGSFSSRLFRNIRTKLGLAYSVGGGIGTAFDHPGILRLSIGTKSQSTVESIQAMYQQVDDLAKQPITQPEIQQAKDSILNSSSSILIHQKRSCASAWRTNSTGTLPIFWKSTEPE